MQWLITGCSTGLGLELARAVLAKGEKCIASSRNPTNTPEAVAEIQKLGGTWVALDVTSPNLEAEVEKLVKEHGQIDVLVNNAGYPAGGILETISLDEAHAQFETNFFGAMRLIQSMIPSMRERKSGTIVNVSSSTYWSAPPITGIYAASKFALEGLSEALAGELAAFNIRVLAVQPGAMRTAFLDPKKMPQPDVHPAYKGTMADFVVQALFSEGYGQGLDIAKTAQAVVAEVLQPCATPPLLRLPLGKESLGAMRAKAAAYISSADAAEKVALACEA